MSDDILRFEDYRRREDADPGLVRCARCGEMILATATRCPECGVHFQGEAQDYLHSSERPVSSRPGWVAVVAFVLVVALVLGALAVR